ncbi:MAG: putative metal-binding motif-containing protein [Deltaproteobacteria bacterium]|nr:putative metal-binding motif-containing protein [Deltaproteobacteria bacterium]
MKRQPFDMLPSPFSFREWRCVLLCTIFAIGVTGCKSCSEEHAPDNLCGPNQILKAGICEDITVPLCNPGEIAVEGKCQVPPTTIEPEQTATEPWQGAATHEDVDGDGHKAVAAGGDDCDDANVNIFPGAADEPDGIDPSLDLNCDGLADGDLSKGWLVDIAAKEEGNGSLVAPFKSMETAWGQADLAASTGQPRTAVYIVAYPPGDQSVYPAKAAVLSPGVRLIGGYRPDSAQPGRYTRDPAQRSSIDLEEGHTISIVPVAEPAQDVVFDTIKIVSIGAGALKVFGGSVVLRNTKLVGQASPDATLVAIAEKGSTSLRLVKDSEVWHGGNVNGAAVAVSAVGKGEGSVHLRFEDTTIRAKAGKTYSIGLQAYAEKKSGSTATMDVVLVNAEIKAEDGAQSYGVLLGGPGNVNFPAPLNGVGQVGSVVIERSRITAGSASLVSGHGVAIFNPKTVVLRNNAIDGGHDLTVPAEKAPIGVQIDGGGGWVINNTISVAGKALVLNPITKIIVVANNILQTIRPWGDGLVLNGFDAKGLYFWNNLFAIPPAKTAVTYYNAPGGVKIQSSDPQAEAKLNGVGVSPKPFGDGGGNLVGDPKFAKDGYHLQAPSSAQLKAKTPPVSPELLDSEAAAGLTVDDARRDVDGELRNTFKWDIGADQISL